MPGTVPGGNCDRADSPVAQRAKLAPEIDPGGRWKALGVKRVASQQRNNLTEKSTIKERYVKKRKNCGSRPLSTPQYHYARRAHRRLTISRPLNPQGSLHDMILYAGGVDSDRFETK